MHRIDASIDGAGPRGSPAEQLPSSAAERTSGGPERSTSDQTQAPAWNVGARPVTAVISTAMDRTGTTRA